MGTQYISKERILLLMSWIYFFAFSSLYIQLPGLYGTKGVTPVHLIKVDNFPKDVYDFLKNPTIFRFLNHNDVNLYDAMEYLIIANVILSSFCVIFGSFRSFLSFFMLWASYLSIYKFGQVFMFFQWDILLLEAGFLTMLLAQGLFLIIPLPKNASSDGLVLWLFKWLLFRLMFASGVVKLQSMCPTWWDLSALSYHFQSQCIPTPVAFYFHQLPEVFLQFGVVATLVIEILIPFLFFVPFKPVRLFSFYSQILLQILIIVSGNYNFFNFLTITLCYSLLEDTDLGKKESRSRRPTTIPSYILSIILIACVFVLAYQFVDVKIVQGRIDSFRLKFTKDQFKMILSKVMPNIVYCATLLFFVKLLTSLGRAVTSYGCMSKIWNLAMVLFIGSLSVCVFTSSMYSFTTLDANTRAGLPEQAKNVYRQLENLELTNSYGLFRRMTGIPKRPELVLEGAMSAQGPWSKIEFHHKPTELARMPSVVAPHQPRLDWQMWFAALGTPQDNPWLYNLIYRMLSNERTVVQLLDSFNMNETPKFIRASLYEYEFTKHIQKSKLWWSRNRKSDFIDSMSLSDDKLKKIVEKNGLLVKEPKASKKTILTDYKNLLREKVGQPKDIYPGILVLILIKITQKFFTR